MARLAKPAALKDAQGNPGRRDIPREADASHATPQNAMKLPFAKLKGDAKRAFDVVGPELRRLNFVRASDTPLLLRYSQSLAQYWKVTHQLEKLGGETYDCPMTGGTATMVRIHPLFMVQERLAKRLEGMEDRLGLSPQARQQYLLRMAATGAQTSLPLPEAPASTTAVPNSPIASLGRPTPPPSALN